MLLPTMADTMADAMSGFGPLDLVLVVIVVSGAIRGLREGLVARAARVAGLIIGLVLAGRTVPSALALLDGYGLSARVFVAVLTFGATITLTTVAVEIASAPIRALARIGPVSIVDRALGGVAGALVVAVLAWLLIPTAAAIPGRVSAEVRASVLLAQLDAATPPPPDITRSLRTLLGGDRAPQVFLELAPTPEPQAPLPDLLDETLLLRALEASTGISVVGCGRSYAGSGFAVSDDLIVTNAHVVAGGREVALRDRDGRLRAATVVVFDKDRDLALLELAGHGLTVLPRGDAVVGDPSVVVGFPGGQLEARLAPARVERAVTGIGRDIYDRDRTERALLFLASELRSGDSGAPVVSAEGEIVGVVFAVSPDVPTAAYALAMSEIDALLAAPRDPGETGRCI
jgi:S1-C subfamily serine protease